MKKSYILIIAIAVLGVEAIILYPSKKTPAPTSSAMNSTSQYQQASPDTILNTNTKASTTNSNDSFATSTGSLKDGSYTGTNETTPYGDVKISINVKSGSIADVTFISMPDSDRHSIELSQIATSRLKSQTIIAQTASISGVSGATYTTEAYINSLQAAIDTAKGA